ncbi:MAG: rod shape-determining protein [Clostridium sp.]|nr:rod shape-determining protein [Clostridium sp.]MCM1398729.1 rod shape-determining protein [Clostridium sp.]MCM1458639.1 rod shape-determining protein [Bacteroides sp.]
MAALTKYPEPLVFGLDIGTRSIVGTVGYKEQNKFNVVAMAVKYHDTRSMIDGQIHDIAKVSEDILFVKEELEKQLNGRKLKDVCIAAAGRVLRTAVGHGEYEFNENTVVTQEYIHSIDLIGVENAHNIVLENLSEDKETTKYYCVGYTVIKYYLNDYEIHNLEGHKGVKIGADVLATFLPEEVVSSLYSAVELAGLDVTNLTLEPIAAINLAIPENYRLLNIALVDVGAGTSDICITKDGSIIGYGMIPAAGDELTEALIKKYLIDFDTAEMLKTASPKRKVINYKDIMGVAHKINAEEISATLESVKKEITGKIAGKIISLNGGVPVSAVFVVGGGGKLMGFTDYLADELGLSHDRVAIRGQEVMNDVNFLVENVKKDALYVTPIGICLSFFDQKNNFIFVNVNGSRVKLYNNDRLTIFDAAVQYGLPNDKLFPKRGKDITFKINGKTRIVRGYDGEAAVIKQNGRIVGMNSPIEANDKIEVVASTVGEKAGMELGELPEYSGTLKFVVNNAVIVCPKFAVVNGHPETQMYSIQDGDEIEMQPYYTLEQLLYFMDVSPEGRILVNNKAAEPTDKIYENFVVEWTDDLSFEDLPEEERAEEAENEEAEETEEIEAPKGSATVDLHIIVNSTPVTLKGKVTYLFVDIFDFYDFDRSKVQGSRLITNVRGRHTDYLDQIYEGDVVEIYWE